MRRYPIFASFGFLVLAQFCISTSARSQECWVYDRTGIEDNLHRVSFADSIHGVAIHSASRIHFDMTDRIYRTNDGGRSWQVASELPHVYDIFMVDTNLVFAVTSWSWFGESFRSDDGGFTWQRQFKTSPLTAVSFFDRDRGISVGGARFFGDDSAVVLMTCDGGSHWSSQRIPNTEYFMTADLVDSSVAFIGGSSGVFRTTSGGNTWDHVLSIDSTDPQRITSVSFLSPDLGVASAEQRTVYRTSDGGTTWTTQSLDDPFAEIKSVCMIDTNRLRAVGTRWEYGRPAAEGVFFSINDAGEHWSPHFVPMFLWDMTYPDPNHGFIVGDGGTILQSSAVGCSYPTDIRINPPDEYTSASLFEPGKP